MPGGAAALAAGDAYVDLGSTCSLDGSGDDHDHDGQDDDDNAVTQVIQALYEGVLYFFVA